MKRWKVLSALLAVVCFIATATAGCVPDNSDIAFPGEPVDGDQVSDPDEDAPTVGPETGQSGTQVPRTVKVALYFSDLEAIDSGTPGATGYVKAVVRELPYTEGVLRLALQELIRGPQPGEGAVGRTLPATTRIIGLIIEEGVAVINFSAELLTAPDSPAGSLGTSIFTQSVIYTATQFPTVDAVLVEVNGEPYSDGHIVWDQPAGRSER